MATIAEALACAVQHHQAGELPAAEAIYRQIVAAAPHNADAWHLLGVVLCQSGQPQPAIDCIGRAIGLDGTQAEFYNSLGNAWKAVGNLDAAVANYRRALLQAPAYLEALCNLAQVLTSRGEWEATADCYRRILEFRPALPELHHGLGVVLEAQGKFDQAVVSYRRALELRPDLPEAWRGLGTALHGQKQFDQAVLCYRRALELQPDDAATHCNLGMLLLTLGKPDAALASSRRALELQPDYAAAMNSVGNACYALGRRDEALACYRRVVELQPDFAEAHGNLGIVLNDVGCFDEALASLRRAQELQPACPTFYYNQGTILQDRGRPGEASACFRRALELQPDLVEACNNLGLAWLALGNLDDAAACFRRVLELNPRAALTHSNILLTQQYRYGVTRAELAAAHAAYNRQHVEPLRGERAAWSVTRDPQRPLRVGFVSPNLGGHPVGYFLVRVVEALDRRQCEAYFYCDRAVHDGVTERFRAAAAGLQDVRALSDEQLARQIREQRIDILFDLAGHTAGNRLLTFARRPAPIQISWLGYEGSTGVETIDYLLADRYTVPPGWEAPGRERVLRMPDGFVCYEPLEAAPDPGPLPARENGYVRFGSFNNVTKIGRPVVERWAQILHRVPHSQLVLKSNALGEESLCRRYGEWFAECGIPPARLEFSPWSDHRSYLAAFRTVDIALDPFPFQGGITTCDALWMGVPVVTSPGATFANRHGLSHLSNVGLTETIARDVDDYVVVAAALAHDLPRLETLRATLRGRVAASPLCDGKRFAAHLMAILRGVWQEWCARET